MPLCNAEPIIRNLGHVTKRSASELLQVGRILVRVIDDGSLSGGEIGAIEGIVPPHTAQTPAHSHRRHTITFLVTSGTLQFSIANGVYRVATGDYIAAPVGVPYTYSNPFAAPATFHCSFTPASFIGYFRDLADLTRGDKLAPHAMRDVMARYQIDLFQAE